MSESLPEEIEQRVWARWTAGESWQDISAWLSRLGYTVAPDEVAAIATGYEQQRDAQARDVGRPSGVANGRSSGDTHAD